MTKARKPRELTPRQAQFVAAYIANGGNGVRAAIEAGYAEKSAAGRAHTLLTTAPAVIAAVAEMRAEIKQRGLYTVERAMVDLDAAAAFCRQHKQGTALVRAQELKMKLSGLLVEKIDLRVQPPDIAQVLIEARKRVQPAMATEYAEVTSDGSSPLDD